MAADNLLNAWIDTNLLLCLLAALWLPTRRLLAPFQWGRALVGQSQALNLVFAAVLLAPILVRVFTSNAAVPLNLSDMLVAFYLDGNVEMSASRFEALLGLRHQLVDTFLDQQALWARLFLALLVAGVAVGVLRFALAILGLRRCLQRAHPWRKFGRLHLVISGEARTPFSACGLWSRYIVLPADLLGHGPDMRFTLAHEFQHLRKSDLAQEIAVELLRPLFVWNPAFHICCRQMRELREMACDQAVAQRRPAELGGYCRSLIRASERARNGRQFFMPVGPAVAFVGSGQGSARESQLGLRILSLTSAVAPGAGRTAWKVVGLLLCVALVMGAVLLRSPSGWSHDRIMLSTIVNLERLDERNAQFSQIRAAEHQPP